MVAHNERPVSPASTPSESAQPLISGTEAAIDAAAYALVEELRNYALANSEHGIPAGQRLLAGQAVAFRSIAALLVGVHMRLDDVYGPHGKLRTERKRDVLMAQLTTYFIPALLEVTADHAVLTGVTRDEVQSAVNEDIDSLFDYALKAGEQAVHDATRDE